MFRRIDFVKALFFKHNKLFLAFIDALNLTLVLYLTSRWASPEIAVFDVLVVSVLYVITFFAVGIWLRIYEASIRHLGIDLLLRLSVATVAAVLIKLVIHTLLDLSVNLLTELISGTYLILLTIGYRIAAREFLFTEAQRSAERTLIYGAGAAGTEFASYTMQGDLLNVVGFVDDDPKLVGRHFHGKVVFSTDKIDWLISNLDVTIVVLAIPKSLASDRKDIIEKLLLYPIRVLTVPTIDEILGGRAAGNDVREIIVEDLLPRAPVAPDQTLLRQNVEGKTILVTGAGGSIGGELARQIAGFGPKKLILLDLNELGLFSIEQHISDDLKSLLVPVLGSVTDSQLVGSLFKEHKIDTVYHAAAYKHVPLVEANSFIAITNNVFGTATLLNAAITNHCQSFTLISTDKAVRPTNLMGATKRLAELICQAAASEQPTTKISIVRFGNVLGSSGSVIPIFEDQISRGGPVTVTHPDITRFFMTIREAAQLVLQASSIAANGDVVLLDMGELVRISDLAVRMIRLAGRTVANDDKEQSPGAIRIVYTGLRPGEKLYEELLVGADAQTTLHPRIMKAREDFLAQKELEPFLQSIYHAAESRDLDGLKQLLISVGTGYQPSVVNEITHNLGQV